MPEDGRAYDVVVDFWEWYRRREAGKSNRLASYALDKCEETFRKCEWKSFGYWYAIYRRERPKSQGRPLKPAGDRD